MRRREFITIVGGTAAWPLAVRAQPSERLPTIGFLGTNATVWTPWTVAFVERLRALGWVEGRTVAIEYRWAEGSTEQTAKIAAEFVRLKVDAIVTNGTSAYTVKQATSAIPIVFPMASDPVAAGLVASLSRPGGNITGLSNMQSDIASKKLELLREAIPHLRRVAIMFNAGYFEAVLERRAAEASAGMLGLELTPLEIQRAEDIAPAFERLKTQTDALYVVVDGLVTANRTRIITLALGARLPTIFNNRVFVQAGGLMAYGPNFSDLFRRTAELVDKILRGANPGNIPVEQPTNLSSYSI
jgi:putative ABC transport system substrate-binding protein